MAHPYKAAAHKSDPKWVRNLNPLVEKAKTEDIKRSIVNYGGDEKATMQAAQYQRPKNQD